MRCRHSNDTTRMETEIKKFIKEYSSEILDGNAAIFAGAGLSMSCGMSSWKELLKDIAEELKLDIDRENDLLSIAQFYYNKKRGRGEINQQLIKAFKKKVTLSDNHRILASLPISTYWTTNYDHLIEESLEDEGKIVDIKKTIENLAQSIPHRDVVIYKMHGDVDDPSKTVLLKDDYEIYHQKNALFITSLKSDLLSKTFLFIGFSFDDPNLSYILSKIRILLEEDAKPHYCIFRSVRRDDFEDEKIFTYEKIRQELRMDDLKRYGIRPILIEKIEQIKDILFHIKTKVLSKSIFISGAAEKYDPMHPDDANKFVFEIARQLAATGNKIVSGFGLGVGSSVVNGVLSYVYSSTGRLLDHHIVLRPFPQNIKDIDERKEKWSRYRKDMISQAGIAIFLFGNKKQGSNTILSDGMREEFEIAKKHKLTIIPVAATGYMAKEIWADISSNLNEYYSSLKLRNAITILNQLTLDQTEGLVTAIIKAVEATQEL